MESRLGGSYLSDLQSHYSNYTLIYKELCWLEIMESRLGGSYLTDLQIHYSNYTLIYIKRSNGQIHKIIVRS
jgi:hypothetical protein